MPQVTNGSNETGRHFACIAATASCSVASLLVAESLGQRLADELLKKGAGVILAAAKAETAQQIRSKQEAKATGNSVVTGAPI